MQEFTYNSVKNLDSRQEMLNGKVSSLGWQAGGFGTFNEQARVITLAGANAIRTELEIFLIGVKAGCNDDMAKECPTLNALIK